MTLDPPLRPRQSWGLHDTLFATLPLFLIGLILVLALITSALPAAAQANCMDRDVLMERLADEWGERVEAAGLSSRGQLIEFWANTESGTWTLSVTAPGGPTCVLDAGAAFQLPTTPAGDPA